MTEMVFGAAPVRAGDPVLPRWWRTIDRVSLGLIVLLFGFGILLGLAASVPLAEKNNLPPYYYVTRQGFFGALAFLVMIATSMLPVNQVRRLGILGFVLAFAALILLPVLGTDFGKGAVRWYSLGFVSVQPSEFLKPGFVIVTAWMMAAAQDIGGPPGRLYSFLLAIVIVLFLAMQPDFGQACLVLFAWGVMYFVAGAPIPLLIGIGGLVVGGGFAAYNRPNILPAASTAICQPTSIHAPRSAMPPTRSRKAASSASASVKAR